MNRFFYKILLLLSISFLVLGSCERFHNRSNVIEANQSILDTAQRYIVLSKDTTFKKDTTQLSEVSDNEISTDTLENKVQGSPDALVAYAITIEGAPYAYGKQDPVEGFDNSGFVNYIFKHFSVDVPRYTAEFAKVGKPINLVDAGPGDIILFSITDSVKKRVGHVGIITSEVGEPISFIHATSGRFKGVVVTKMNSYYQKRLMGIRTLFR